MSTKRGVDDQALDEAVAAIAVDPGAVRFRYDVETSDRPASNAVELLRSRNNNGDKT